MACISPAKPRNHRRPAYRSAIITVWAVAAANVPAPLAAEVLESTEIDRAVRAFTGAAIGDVGGALEPADPRLRLAACARPLNASWHGTTKSAVKVECAETRSGARPWRIFVATRAASQPAATPSPLTTQAPTAPLIKRGDPVTVVVRGRGFTVQQAGEAMENGHLGDWIGVRTARQADPVRARIERPGLAVIPVG